MKRALLWIAAGLVACGGSHDPQTGVTSQLETQSTSPNGAIDTTVFPVQGHSPALLHLPPGYDGSTPLPLVIELHGLLSDPDAIENYFHFIPLADQNNFILVRPHGHGIGNYWDATDACCGDTSEFDVDYFRHLVDDLEDHYAIDPNRMFVIGHSNGGYMAHRLACEMSDKFSAIVSLSGGTWADASQCYPTDPDVHPAQVISVAEVHATGDGVRRFEGDGPNDPGAVQTVNTWGSINGCTGQIDPDSNKRPQNDDNNASQVRTHVSIDKGDNGNTTVYSLAGCSAGVNVELWVIPNSQHMPPLSNEASGDFVNFVLSHPRAVTPREF